MTEEEFQREKNYRVSMAIAKEMLEKGIINIEDYEKIKEIFIEKYNPLLGRL
ncbi:SHOCT domain-containing protein [Anaerobranca gottschalkii]|uniref:SHOCT-like domain-containing protein n=1 Tax=Anaerobranca gottschalkii DSM 13577 TaxID=1120990 RepID=A0A1I0B849_9FIRM|nr:SHOCT domain-containing protein [Anaerobranca gottschalkii]SET03051.1 hypothetical protein SAMN03080614_10345 [Anaerobranca gottschalkii DSM 13577]